MISLKKLVEAAGFKPSPDQKPFDGDRTVSFNNTDTAVVDPSKKLHNLASHAIKHLEEFDPSFVTSILTQVKGFLSNLNFQKIFILGDKGIDIEMFGLKAKKNLSQIVDKNVLLNTLDRINDKTQKGEPLTDEEKELTSFIVSFSKHYRDLLLETLQNAMEIENISMNDALKFWKEGKTIKFNGISTKGIPTRIYINSKNKGCILEDTTGNILTFFKISENNVKDFIKRKFPNVNPSVEQFFSKI